MKKLLMVLFLLLAAPVFAAPSVTGSNSGQTGGGNQISGITITPSGSDRMVFAFLMGLYIAGYPSGATYNDNGGGAVAMTLVVGCQASTEFVYIYRTATPPSTNQGVVTGNFNGTVAASMHVIAVSGVSPTTPAENHHCQDGTAATGTVTISNGTADDLALGGCSIGVDSSNYPAISTGTEIIRVHQSGDSDGTARQTSSASVVMNWSISDTTVYYQAAGFTVKAVGSGGAAPPKRRTNQT